MDFVSLAWLKGILQEYLTPHPIAGYNKAAE